MFGRNRIVQRLGTVLLPLVAAACAGGDVDTNANAEAGAEVSSVPAAPAAAPSAAANPDDRDDLVERALDADPTLQAYGLDADDDARSIVLRGVVASEEHRDLAGQVATREAAGVPVDNRIRVDAGASGAGARPVDVDDVEERVEDALEADAALREFDLDVDEENGQIVLEGTVRTAEQRDAAETTARGLAGSVVVVNRIRVQ